MEAEAADALLGVVAVGDGVHVVARGDGLVEGRVEGGHLQHVAEDLAAALDDAEGAGVVQGREVGVALHRGDDALVHAHRAAVLGAGVRHAVAHGVYLGEA